MAKKMKKLLALVLTFAMVLSFVSVGAFAAEGSDESEYICGYDVHEHDEACYEQVSKCELDEDAKVLTCVKGEHEHDAACSHTHVESCYQTCGKELCAEEHEHNEDCHPEHIADCTSLVCGMEEGLICTTEPHAHGDECYVTHVHDAACYESKLVCEKFVHTHDETCVAQPKVRAIVPITGTIDKDMTWNDGAIVGDVTIEDDVTITVKGTVTVTGTIRLSPDNICDVTFEGEDGAMLIRGGGFTGQMFYVEGKKGNFQELTFDNIILDGGAVWTGETDATLNRGTTNSGVKATGSVLYLVYANAVLDGSTLQNHDDSTGEKANAVFLRYYSTIEFDESVVKDNNSPSGYYSGGVITVRQGGTVITNGAEVYGNSGAQGGFFGVSSTGSYGGICEVYNSEFHNNYADCGAIFDMQCNGKIGYLLIDGCKFYDNASNRGLIYEHAYSRPVIISDSSFYDNECAVWDCHTDPILDLSGKIVVKEDDDYAKYLFETPLGIGEALADGSSIALSEASYAKLMESGYLMTELPTDNYYNPDSKYTIVASDMEKLDGVPSGMVLIKVDVDGNGMLDVVPATAATTTNVNLYENFKMGTSDESNRKEVQAVSDVVDNIPIAVWFHEGFYFAGWATEAGGAAEYYNAKTAATYADGTELYATWKLQTPELTLGRTDPSDPYCNTLEITVENWSDDVEYTYQWYKNDIEIEGATSDVSTITETAKYKCVVTASAEGFVSVNSYKDGNATYKEAPKVYVAEIVETGKKYETLAEAVADANAMSESATIVMLADVFLSEGLTISNDVTIKGDHSITRAADAVETSKDPDHNQTSYVPGDKAYYWDMFTVDAGATLTLDGGIILDGNNNWTLGAYDAKSDGYAPTGEAGMPGAGGGAYMIQNNGTLNVLDATLQNQYGNHDGGGGFSGAINVGNNSVTTLDGATIKHIASRDGGSAVYMQNGANAVLNIKGDTLITDIYGGYNGSVIRAYGSDTINMSGGTISDCYCDYGGSVLFVYSSSTMNFTGGTITQNWGNGNGVIYLHSGSTLNMTEGTISDNTFYTSAIYGRSGATKITVSGGTIIDNTATYSAYAEKDYNDYYSSVNSDKYYITGGVYTQDVNKWCAPGYVCIPYDDTAREDDYIVVPGYRVSYYTVETDAETQASVTTWVNDEFLLIPEDKKADEVDLFATPYCHLNSEETQGIKKWYTDVELATEFDYTTEVTENIKLYGNTWEDVNFVAEIVETGKTYETLAAAVADANAMESATIKMLKDVTLGEKLTISGDVTIEGEHTITRDDAYTGTLFVVNAGAALTLDGGLTIDGGNNYAFDQTAYDGDMADWNTSIAKENSAKWFAPEEGAPVAAAFMITTTGGTVNLNEVTIQNNYSIGSGVVSAGADSTITLTGAKITHVAATQGNGVVANVSGANINVTVNEGTVIDGNHVGGNHGLFKIYSGAKLTMNGGEITNTTGWNSNGTVVGVYWGTFIMNGGTICSNSSVYGPANGRNSAIYLHSGHKFEMNGGSICCNSGRARGGIDAPYSNGTATITDGMVLDNVSCGGWDTYDVNGTAAMKISGGIYTQDVNQWCAEGYVCVPYDDTDREDDYIVLPGIVVTFDDQQMVYGNDVPAELTYTIRYGNIEEGVVNVHVEAATITAPEIGEHSITGTATLSDGTGKAEDYAVLVVDGKLTVKEAVCEMNGVYYATIQDAINAAKKVPSTITVLKDHTVDVNTRSYGYPVLLNGHDITLDLNGKVVTFDYEVKTGSDVSASIYLANRAKLTVEDSSDERTGKLYNKYETSGAPRIIWVTSGCSATIEGGIFETDQQDTMFYVSNFNSSGAVPSLYITGGLFLQHGKEDAGGTYDCFNVYDGGPKEYIELTGGTYSNDPRTGFQNDWEITIPEGYTVIDNGNGTWTVSPYLTVTFDDKAMIFGNDVPALTYTIDYNYIGEGVIGVQVDVNEITNPVVGTHEITGTVALTDGTGKAENYAVKIVAGKLTVRSPETPYTVDFDSAGGSDVEDQFVKYGKTVTVPAQPTKEGYDFAGWTLNGEAYDFSTPVDEDITLVAQWEKLYTVTYKSGNKVVQQFTSLKTGDEIPDADDLDDSFEYFAFEGWSLTKGIEGRRGTVGTTDLVYTAVFETNAEDDEEVILEDEDVPLGDVPSALREDHIAYVTGDGNGLVRPEDNITRAEVAMIFYRLLNDETRALYTTNENNFPDVNEDDWFCTAVSTLNAMGIIYGKPDGTFDPDAYITRAEFAAIAARFDPITPEDVHFFDDIDGHWAEYEIRIAATKGWVKGYNGLFRPNDSILRAEAFALVNNVLYRNPATVGDLLDGMIVWPDNMDPSKWYYLAVQEASNSHTYVRKTDGTEYWVALTNDEE